MKRDKSVYEIKYPHYLPWSKLIWLISINQLVKYEGNTYVVHQILKSSLRGSTPKLVLQEQK